MKKILTLVLILFSTFMAAQYDLYREVNGVEFYTKWGHEKWWSKKSPKVLLVKVVNKNDVAVNYELGIDFFKNLQPIESSRSEAYCLGAGKSLSPRAKGGIVLRPATMNAGQIDTFELTGLDVEKTTMTGCTAE